MSGVIVLILIVEETNTNKTKYSLEIDQSSKCDRR
jgi:hypothetical protein